MTHKPRFAQPDMPDRQVRVWTFPTKSSPASLAAFERVLDGDEAKRAARFHFRHLYTSFVIAHGALRYLLARTLDCSPAQVDFAYGSKGKPALAPPSDIQFNMTHSGDLAMIALTVGCEIGVDLEQFRALPDMRDIADRFFCPEETTAIMSLPRSQREQAFFSCWTRKEAYIKATGDGLSAPLDSFCVTVRPDIPVRLVHLEHDEGAAAAWKLHDLAVAEGYAAALAYRDRERPLAMFSAADPAELIEQA